MSHSVTAGVSLGRPGEPHHRQEVDGVIETDILASFLTFSDVTSMNLIIRRISLFFGIF
jgi:hypothetical protein